MKKTIIILYIFFIIALYVVLYTFNSQHNEKVKNIEIVKIDSTITVSFSAVGDIMCHSTQYNYAWVEKDSFNFDPVFFEIKNYLLEKDVLIGNFETVLAGNNKQYSGYPFFNSPNQLAHSLKNAGFDFLITANNHSNDKGFNGVKRTLEYLRRIGIVPIGTTSLDTVKNENLFNKKGLKFGLLAYTYGTNYNENAKSPREYVNYIDTLRIKNDINNLKNKNADLIIVYLHFGKEYQRYISKYQQKIVNKTVEYGADIIIGSHPHILQQFEQFAAPNSKVDTGFVVYSLGNFVSNQRWRYSDGGAIFNFEIEKNIITDSVYISDISFLPIWVFKGNIKNDKEFVILPSANYENNIKEYMTEADIDSMKKSYFDTIELLTSKSNKLKVDTLLTIKK